MPGGVGKSILKKERLLLKENKRIYEDDIKAHKILFFLSGKNDDFMETIMKLPKIVMWCIFIIFLLIVCMIFPDEFMQNKYIPGNLLTIVTILVIFLVISLNVDAKLKSYLKEIKKHLNAKVDKINSPNEMDVFLSMVEEYLFFFKVEKDGLAPISPIISVFFVMFTGLVGFEFFGVERNVLSNIFVGSFILSIILFLLVPNMKFYSSMILILESIKNNIVIKKQDKELSRKNMSETDMKNLILKTINAFKNETKYQKHKKKKKQIEYN
jgi:hypothetical protein